MTSIRAFVQTHLPANILRFATPPCHTAQRADTQCVAKRAILGCEMGRFEVQNGPFRSTKRAVSQYDTAHGSHGHALRHAAGYTLHRHRARSTPPQDKCNCLCGIMPPNTCGYEIKMLALHIKRPHGHRLPQVSCPTEGGTRRHRPQKRKSLDMKKIHL